MAFTWGGYEEIGLDRDFDSFSGEATLLFSPTDDMDISLMYGKSVNNTLGITNVGEEPDQRLEY